MLSQLREDLVELVKDFIDYLVDVNRLYFLGSLFFTVMIICKLPIMNIKLDISSIIVSVLVGFGGTLAFLIFIFIIGSLCFREEL